MLSWFIIPKKACGSNGCASRLPVVPSAALSSYSVSVVVEYGAPPVASTRRSAAGAALRYSSDGMAAQGSLVDSSAGSTARRRRGAR